MADGQVGIRAGVGEAVGSGVWSGVAAGSTGTMGNRRDESRGSVVDREASTEGGCKIGKAAKTGEGSSSEAAEDRGDPAQKEWAAVKELAARGALHRLGWEHLDQEGGRKMAAEEAASGDQGWGSTMGKGW